MFDAFRPGPTHTIQFPIAGNTHLHFSLSESTQPTQQGTCEIANENGNKNPARYTCSY